MRKRLLVFTSLLFLLHSFVALAVRIDANTAHKLADNFYFEVSIKTGENVKAAENLVLSYTKFAATEEMYYIFSSKNGYVIISADNDVYPVLAYSFEGNYQKENISPEFDAWMNDYEKQILYIKNHSIEANEQIKKTWNKYLTDAFVPQYQKSETKSVSPLLLSTWDQGMYYNYLCPEDAAGQGGHVWSGCVATAMAQVMYYYRYPSHGTGSHGYNSDYGYLSADFGNTTYNWNVMQNSISGKYNFDMAQLQLHCGVAIDMHYSPDGSGAYMWDDADAMKTYFGYSSTTELFQRSDYNDTDWANLIIANLDNKMPVQYAGYGEEGGHAFVCDGYQGTNYFHFNWGWSGSYNGYFYLNNLNPGYTFNDGQQAILNSYPAADFPQNCAGLTTINSTYGTIEDGSSPKYNYQDNQDCMWLIAPTDIIDNIRINFDRFETDSNDIVTIYDGESTSDPILGIFSGNALPQQLISSGTKVLVRFTSNGSVNAEGWLLTFNGKVTSFCNSMTELNSTNGTFGDGSDIYNYNSNTFCRWRINLPSASNIDLYFNSFELAADTDFIRIYNEETSALIATFNNASPPQSLSMTTSKVLVFFKTNGYENAQGWEIHYTSTPLAVQENTGTYLLIAPNPARDYLTVESNLPDISQANLEIINSLGETILTKGVNCDGNKLLEKIDISRFSQGIYFLKLSSENFHQTQRFTKQ